ncbi:complex I subunit 5 family protein [Thermococcus barophilus]|uniref:Membrane bound subgroup 4b [NiFe]-hydrogenase MBH(B)3, subunit Mbh(B)3H n=1 Tax=Thermococcus barophilus TaxID=55802 RepID=A0A0S1XD23_THEBA|nr:proton-conducting transporter membrane subunit [Thermococcus barophilus]ALM75673.1 Membrane bound subgroup 4b [NiFe]-hydrogenase MBH(b)3, subunit Mbh(b)3H' [Thermococcus barophilus]
MFSIDNTSLLFALNVAILGLAALIASLKYMEIYEFKSKIPYYPTLIVFIASMLFIPLVRDWLVFLFLWETMTFSSYLLIIYDWPEERVRNTGWKYFVTMHIFCTLPLVIGVALYYISKGSFAFAPLSGTYATAIVALFLVGFAAKAGLFPLHFWLPDAHPAAPSPVSALMSGAMVELGLYGSIRILQAVNWSVSPWIVNLILVMAVLSMLAAIFSYGIQDDVKSLFAWSTIDNMGWLYLLVVAGLLGASGVEKGISYYVLAHGLAKGAAFMTTGALLYVFGTRSLSKMKGMINADQLTAGLMIASIFALEGVPPFNFFLNKLNVIKTLLTVNTTLAYFVAIEWVIAFILFLRIIHRYVISEGKPEAKRKLAGSITAGVVILLVLSMVSQFIANYIWVR